MHADPGDDERDAAHDDADGRGGRRLAQVGRGEGVVPAPARAGARTRRGIGRRLVIGDGLYAVRPMHVYPGRILRAGCRTSCRRIRARSVAPA